MDRHHHSYRSHGDHESHRSSRHGRRENSDISVSSSQPVFGDHVYYGGFCRVCNVECDDLGKHHQRHHQRPIQADLDALMGSQDPERPRYGKEMHPSNTNFSAHNTMTTSSSNSRQIPLEKEDEDENEEVGS